MPHDATGPDELPDEGAHRKERSEKAAGELPPGEQETLSALAEQWQADLEQWKTELDPYFEEQRREELVKTRTIKFSQPTLDFLEALSDHFGTTEADIVRAMCSQHRLSYSVPSETVDALIQLISLFAGAFSGKAEGAASEAKLDRQRTMAQEMLRQAEIYRDYERGISPAVGCRLRLDESAYIGSCTDLIRPSAGEPFAEASFN